MDDRCIFCGTELGLLNKKKLHCGNTTQDLCKECYPKYKILSTVERVKAALNSGRAEDADALQNYLENIQQVKQKETNQEKRITDLKCLRCGGQMLDHGPATFKLGEETYFFSDWNRLITGAVTLTVYRCETCGKVEFFAFDDGEFSKQFGE